MARFFRRGTSKIFFLPVCVGTSPLRTEIAAGTDLSPFVNNISGFQLTNSPIATPDLAHAFTSQIGGEDTVANSALTVYDESTSAVRAAINKGDVGFIILMPYGDIAAKRCEKWPVTCIGFNDEWSMGNDHANSLVGFACAEEPVQNGVIPAHT